jgi:cytochrome o ubiquinol oxidase subunit I
LMGATRRLDHYSASIGWQQLFIVAAVGVAVIIAGVCLQVLQLAVSIRDRNSNRDKTGDPWKGRTLEWATASPAPFYNFAVIPEVDSRDAFWAMKKAGTAKDKPVHYEDIEITKNSPYPIIIGILAFSVGFGLIWHMYWLALIALLAAITCIIIRVSAEDNDYVLPAAEVRKLEEARA